MERHFLTRISSLLLLGTVAITSCQKEDPAPTITLGDYDAQVTMYKGDTKEIPFSVTTKGVASVTAQVIAAQGCDASVSAGATGGTLRLTLKEKSGSATADIQSGEAHQYITVRAEAYYLEVKDAPEDRIENFGDGNEMTFTVTLDTNLPDGMVSVTGEDWMTVNAAGNKVSVTLQDNRTIDVRKGTLSITDKESKLDTRTVSVTQDWNYEKEEGYVYFADRNLFRAVIRTADRDGDGRISPDEALDLTELDASGYGIADLSGIGQLENLEILNLKNNNLEGDLNLSDLRMLHSLELARNKVTSLDLTGCCKIFSYLNHDSTLGVLKANSPFLSLEGNHNEMTVSTYENADERKNIPEVTHESQYILNAHDAGNGIKIYVGISCLDMQDFADGSFMRLAKEINNRIFSIEPMKSYKKYFDIILVSDIINYENLRSYHARVEIKGEGGSFAVLNSAYCTIDNSIRSVNHELVGHALAKLMDEAYTYAHRPEGPNIDYTSNPNEVKWKRFFELSEYKEKVGAFQITDKIHNINFYIPSETSVMGKDPERENTFNAPSRYAIFCSIMSLSGEHPDWKPDYSEESFQAFLEYDKINL